MPSPAVEGPEVRGDEEGDRQRDAVPGRGERIECRDRERRDERGHAQHGLDLSGHVLDSAADACVRQGQARAVHGPVVLGVVEKRGHRTRLSDRVQAGTGREKHASGQDPSPSRRRLPVGWL
jgi:hypothetical protein